MPDQPTGTGDGRPKSSIGSIIAAVLAGLAVVSSFLQKIQPYFPATEKPAVVATQPITPPTTPATVPPDLKEQVEAFLNARLAAWEARQKAASPTILIVPAQGLAPADPPKPTVPRGPDIPPSSGRP